MNIIMNMKITKNITKAFIIIIITIKYIIKKKLLLILLYQFNTDLAIINKNYIKDI